MDCGATVTVSLVATCQLEISADLQLISFLVVAKAETFLPIKTKSSKALLILSAPWLGLSQSCSEDPLELKYNGESGRS